MWFGFLLNLYNFCFDFFFDCNFEWFFMEIGCEFVNGIKVVDIGIVRCGCDYVVSVGDFFVIFWSFVFFFKLVMR